MAVPGIKVGTQGDAGSPPSETEEGPSAEGLTPMAPSQQSGSLTIVADTVRNMGQSPGARCPVCRRTSVRAGCWHPPKAWGKHAQALPAQGGWQVTCTLLHQFLSEAGMTSTLREPFSPEVQTQLVLVQVLLTPTLRGGCCLKSEGRSWICSGFSGPHNHTVKPDLAHPPEHSLCLWALVL